MAINPTKDSRETTDNRSSREVKENVISHFMNLLIEDTNHFKSDEALDCIQDYVDKYDRIAYAPISYKIYQCSIENEKVDENENGPLDNITTNIDKLVSRVDKVSIDQDDKNKIDTRKAIYKISDHINLAQQQYKVLRESDDEYQKRFNSLIGEQKEKITQEMTTHLVTMVSIFTALAFLIFGGISSLDSIFSTKNLSIIKIITLATVWGLAIIDLIFIFLFCIGRLTNLTKRKKNIFKQFKLVWIINYILIVLLIFSLWIYFIHSNGITAELMKLIQQHHWITMIGGTTFLILLFVISGRLLWKASFKENKDPTSKKRK